MLFRKPILTGQSDDAFTAQIIINHVEARDGECIDNMDQNVPL